jgi:hypothetical protein
VQRRWDRAWGRLTAPADTRWTAGTWASLVLVAVLVVFGVVVGLTRGSGESPTTPAPPLTAPAALLLDRDQSIPTVAPKVSWTDFQGVALPENSAVYGPARYVGDAAVGWAHTPRGSLLAMIHASTRSVFAADWQDVYANELADNKGRRVLTDLRSGYTGVAGASDPDQMQIAGFKFVFYSDDLATISIASSSPVNGTLQAVTMTVIWSGGDWRLTLLNTGAQAATGIPLNDLNGYVVFVPGGAS